MSFIRHNNGLFTDDSFPLYLPDMAVCVVNEPMPAHQLNGVRALIYYGNLIRKQIFCTVGHRVLWLKLGFNLYGNVVGGTAQHHP